MPTEIDKHVTKKTNCIVVLLTQCYISRRKEVMWDCKKSENLPKYGVSKMRWLYLFDEFYKWILIFIFYFFILYTSIVAL